jgi:hypothetical protein
LVFRVPARAELASLEDAEVQITYVAPASIHLGEVEMGGRDPGQERLPGPGDERVNPQVQLVQLPAGPEGPG